MSHKISHIVILCCCLNCFLSAQVEPYFSKAISLNRYQQAGFGMTYDGDQHIYIATPSRCEENTDGTLGICDGIIKADIEGNVIWVDTSRWNHTTQGYAFFWHDSLLYFGSSVINVPRDSQVMLSAMTADGEQVWQQTFDRPGQVDEGNNSFRPYSQGFMQGVGYGWDTCEGDCDSNLVRFFDFDLNIKREWSVYNHYSTPGFNGQGSVELPDGTFIGSDTGCGVLALCGGVTRFDSLGNRMWDIFLDQNAYHSSFMVPKLTLLNDGDVVASWITSYDGVPHVNSGVMVFYRINPEGEFVWTLLFEEDIDKELKIMNIYTLANGDILGLGWRQLIREEELEDEWESCGYMIRISPEGEILWEREICDELIADDAVTRKNMLLRRAAELPNGDLIIVGDIDTRAPPDAFSDDTGAVWLLRTDSMGCLTPGCEYRELLTSTRTIHWQEENKLLEVWPNPVQDQLQLQFLPNDFRKNLYFRLVDVLGRPVLDKELEPSSLQSLDVSELIPGLYYWQLYGDGALLQSGTVVKGR